jgi:hypothetical protein
MTQATETETAPTPRTSARIPAPGDRVVLDARAGRPVGAVVIRTYRPGDPATRIDATPYGPDGIPRPPVVYLARASEDDPAGWAWPDEAPPPPPTLEERFAAMRAAGRPVPEVGDDVIWIDDDGRGLLVEDRNIIPVARRARVQRVYPPDRGTEDVLLDLEVWPTLEPPEDPREAAAERPLTTVSTAYHGFEPGRWCMPEDLARVDLRPRPRPAPSVPCDRCGELAAVIERVMIRLDGETIGSCCPTCAEELRGWFAGPVHVNSTGA